MDPITEMLLKGLIYGASGMAAGALQEIGREAYVTLKERVLQRFQSKAKVESTLDLLEDEPESEAFQTRLKTELEKGIQADPTLEQDTELREAAQKLLSLLEETDALTTGVVKISLKGSGAIAQGPGAVAAGQRGVAIGGNVEGATIITGDNQKAQNTD